PCSPCSPCSPWSRAFARDHGCARLRAAARGAALRAAGLRAPARAGGRGAPGDRVDGQCEEVAMLRIYDVALDMVDGAALVAEKIEKRDRDLGRQMRRALTSVV